MTKEEIHEYFYSKFNVEIAKSSSFSLIKFIVFMAGLAILRSISPTGLKSNLSNLKNDEVQANLNSLAEDYLKTHAYLAERTAVMPTPSSSEANLPSRYNYKENSSNSIKYFEVNPKDSNSKTHFSMGFGIPYGKITRFTNQLLLTQRLQLL